MASHNEHPLPVVPGQGQQNFNQNTPHYPQQHVQYNQQQQSHVQQQQRQAPSPPQHQYPPGAQQKPRPRSRGFSFRSDKSHKSSGSNGQVPKLDLHETHQEKEAKRLHTKADPSVAMNEAEPSAVQATAKTLLAPLRGIQHKDAFGNPIADPDRSNPTRSRWERPLDTIRSFEAAIDGGYNRKSYLRSADSDLPVTWNKRSSQYGTNGGPSGSSSRFPHDSYYGGRPQSTIRAESHFDPRQQRESYYADSYQGAPSNGYSPGPNGPDRRRYPRTASEPHFNSHRQQQQQQHQADPSVYPIPNNTRSYETVASASGSGTSGEREPAGYQTDLTSDNSSAERVQAPQRRRQEPSNDYGIGFSQNASSYQPSGFTVGVKGPAMNLNAGQQVSNGYQNGGDNGYGAPAVPQKGGLLRKQSTQTSQPAATPSERPAAGEKRKSWFGRKFGKN